MSTTQNSSFAPSASQEYKNFLQANNMKKNAPGALSFNEWFEKFKGPKKSDTKAEGATPEVTEKTETVEPKSFRPLGMNPLAFVAVVAIAGTLIYLSVKNFKSPTSLTH